MPDFRNCKRCGKVYTYTGGAPLCQACRDKDDEDFRIVKEYLYKNPGATLSEVSTVLDISIEKIKRFLRDGRLEIMDDVNMILACENCGKLIKTGRFCEACSHLLATDMKSTAARMKNELDEKFNKEHAKERMRYLNKNDK